MLVPDVGPALPAWQGLATAENIVAVITEGMSCCHAGCAVVRGHVRGGGLPASDTRLD